MFDPRTGGIQTKTESASPVRDVVAIGASAGGLVALREVLGHLPADFPAPIVVVQHLDPDHRSAMAELLTKRTPLDVVEARDGDALARGVAHLAPPDHHLLVGTEGRLSLSSAAQVHFLRPSADLLFDSVAETYGDGAIAVVLTGTGSDGSDGVRRIKELGGTVISQDEASSDFPGMPASAIRTGCVDHVLPLGQIAGCLVDLLRERAR